LGLFGANCSSARSLTTVPERWAAGWDEMAELAVMADGYGIDFLLPIARWKGYGGDTDFQGTSFETITWATGLLAITKAITVFGTVHVPLFHPVIAAKQMVTADHVGQGRFGLNVVAGWNEDEFEMFGIARNQGHEARYEQADEWIQAVSLIWSQDDFDFRGKFYNMAGVRSNPKPYGDSRPVIMNAAVSADGQSFAIRNSDAYFTGIRMTSFDERSGVMVPAVDEASKHVALVREKARTIGRTIGIFTRSEIVCRPTQREAADYYRYYVEERADWAAIDRRMKITMHATPDMPDYDTLRRQHLHGFPIIGDPDRVAGMLTQLSAAGFDGVGLSFVNYLTELPYFCDEVIPRLERSGVRTAIA
jgi:FMNH2-dependent dimethyl sulfone monooxygenase